MIEAEIWKVEIVSQAKKAPALLPKNILATMNTFFEELKHNGPHRHNWPNFTKMHGREDYHCHIKKGKPTYVICWRTLDKKRKILEVYYAGTHEKAPY